METSPSLSSASKSSACCRRYSILAGPKVAVRTLYQMCASWGRPLISAPEGSWLCATRSHKVLSQWDGSSAGATKSKDGVNNMWVDPVCQFDSVW